MWVSHARDLRRRAAAAALLLLCAVPPVAHADSRLDDLLESGELERSSNPVPVNYLLNEGRGKLDADREQAAIESLSTALRVQTSPMLAMLRGTQAGLNSPTLQRMRERMAKQSSGTSAAAGIVGGLFGLPSVSQPAPASPQETAQLQREFEQGMADPWVRGIEAAQAYVALGDAQAAGRFYTSCVSLPFGIEWLIDACLDAVLRLGPARAFVLLSWMVERPEQAVAGARGGAASTSDSGPFNDQMAAQVRSAGLDGLGRLVGTGGLDAAQREQAMRALLQYADGKQNGPYLAGAAAGLGASRDPRAIEPLRSLSRRWGREAAVREAAARGLVVGFNDPDATAQLRKFLDDDDAERRFRAAALLFEIGDQPGLDWAIATVTGKRAAEDPSPDIRARVTRDLFERGGDAGMQALELIHRKGAGNDWLQAWVAVTLLQAGKPAYLPEVRAALARQDWTLDRPGIRAWWGRVSPFLQLALQAALTGTVDVQQAAQVIGNLVAAERGRFAQKASLEEMLLAQLHWQAADAFGAVGLDETVPDLRRLLADDRPVVRLSAARALALHRGSRVIDAYPAAFTTDFGEENGVPRAPEVRSALLRSAITRHRGDTNTQELCRLAASDSDPGVRFIALVELAAGSDQSPTSKRGELP